jgi:hypothetical protein
MSAEPVPSAELSAVDSRGTGVRIRFFWQGDRYSHRIDALDGTLTRTILESVEGGPLDDWPPSPPLQDVNVSWIASDSEHGHVAMLAGASGKSHWSMCVAARDQRTYSRDKSREVKLFVDGMPLSEREETELLFDIACRTEEAPAFLGTTYGALFHQVAVSSKLNCAFIPADAPGLVIASQDSQLELETTRSASPLLRYKVTDIRFSELPATLRWRYAIRRSSGGPIQAPMKKRGVRR